jgi:hypothetical protein
MSTQGWVLSENYCLFIYFWSKLFCSNCFCWLITAVHYIRTDKSESGPFKPLSMAFPFFVKKYCTLQDFDFFEKVYTLIIHFICGLYLHISTYTVRKNVFAICSTSDSAIWSRVVVSMWKHLLSWGEPLKQIEMICFYN